MTKKLLIALATLALAAFALVACGDDDEETTSAAEETTETTETPSGGGGETILVEADPSGELAWVETELTGTAGDVTIEMDNPATTPHNVYIEDESGSVLAESETVTESSTTTTASLEPGTYTFFCDIPAHRDAGMEGSLTLE